LKDIHNILLTSYYSALNGNIPNPSGGDPIPVFEGEEPDNYDAPIYVVLNDISDTDVSPKQLNQSNATVLVSVHSRRNKYNNRKNLNIVCGSIIGIIKPQPHSTLQADGIDIMSTSLDTNTVNYGYIANQVFTSRNLIFSHLISY